MGSLNTITGAQGEQLQALTTQFAKSNVSMDAFRTIFAGFNLTADEGAGLMDRLTVAGEAFDVNLGTVASKLGRYKGELDELGLSMDQQIALALHATNEGRSLRDVVKELEAGTGDWRAKVNETVPALEGSAGATERAYEAGRTWRDVLGETTERLKAQVAPYGDIAAGMGSVVTAVTAMGGVSKIMTVVGTAARGMWRGLMGPFGLVLAGIAALGGAWALWGDQILDFIRGPWNGFVSAIEGGLEWLAPFASKIGIDLPTNLDSFKIGIEDATGATDNARPSFADLAAQVDAAGAESETATPKVGTVTAAIDAAGRAAETTADKFERLKIDGIRSFDDLSSTAQAVIQNRMVREMSGIAGAGGLDVSAAFAAGFLGDGPGGMMTALPAGAVGALERMHGAALPKFADSGLAQGGAFVKAFEGYGGSISDTLIRALEGGGGFLGGIASLGVQAGQRLTGALSDAVGGALSGVTGKVGGSLGGLLNGALGVALPMIGPALGAAASWIGGKLFGLFKKPSEAEKAARESFASFQAMTADALAENATYHDVYNAHIRDGWDHNLAQTLAAFATIGMENGKTYDQAVADYTRYQDAVGSGNTALMRQLEAEYGGMLQANTEAAAAAAEQQRALLEQTYSAAVSAYDRAKQAGIDAYDSVYLKAIEAGLGEEAATAKATAAQLAARDEILSAEGEKFARLAAFEAALEAHRTGNADSAAEAARRAAEETRAAWDTAMGAVEAADQAATDAMQGNAETTKGEWQAMTDDMAEKFEAMTAKVATDSEAALDAVIDDIDRLPDEITIPVHYDGRQTGDHSPGGEGEGFQFGTRQGGSFGYGDFGAGTGIVGHGREAIVPRGGVGDLAADIARALGGAGSQNITLHATFITPQGDRIASETITNLPRQAGRLRLR